MRFCANSLLYASNVVLIFCVVKLEEYELREVVVEIEFQGKFR